MTYKAYQLDQQAIADKWMEANKSELSDFQCPDTSAAARQGYEVVDDIVLAIAEEEAALAVESDSIWTDASKDSHNELMARFDVSNLTHWKRPVEFDDTGKAISSRFDALKFYKHEMKCSKRAKHQGIDHLVLNKAGKVRVELPPTATMIEEKAVLVAQRIRATAYRQGKTKTTELKKLGRLQRIAALNDAKRAREAKANKTS